MIVCYFWFPLIWVAIQLKGPNKDSVVQIILWIVLKHHTFQVIKADRVAEGWVCSPTYTPILDYRAQGNTRRKPDPARMGVNV